MPPPDVLTQGASVSPHVLSVLEALMRFSLALVLGALLAYRPWRRWMPNVPATVQETVHTQLLIAVAGAVMTTVIGDSMSRAFGLVGLGGFIRFRSGIKDSRDAAVMFVLIGVGMACGLGAFQIALCATLFLGAVLMVLDSTAAASPAVGEAVPGRGEPERGPAAPPSAAPGSARPHARSGGVVAGGDRGRRARRPGADGWVRAARRAARCPARSPERVHRSGVTRDFFAPSQAECFAPEGLERELRPDVADWGALG